MSGKALAGGGASPTTGNLSVENAREEEQEKELAPKTTRSGGKGEESQPRVLRGPSPLANNLYYTRDMSKIKRWKRKLYNLFHSLFRCENLLFALLKAS